MSKTLLSMLAAVAMAGCVGTLEPTPPGGGTGSNPGNGAGPDAGAQQTGNQAKPLFDQNVYPIITAKCMSCHSSAGPAGNTTGFVATDATQGYTTITSYQSVVGNYTTATAGILGMPASNTSPHTSTMYSADDITKITAWLDKEAEVRSGSGNAGSGSGTGSGSGSGSGTGGSPAQVTQQLLAQWSGCMTQANFDQAKMAQAWGNMTAQNNQTCKNCHVNGAEGFIASDQSTPFFTVISTNKYYLLQYFTVDLTQGTANAKVTINTTSFANVANGHPPDGEHPRFNPTNNQGMTALQSFYTLTQQAMAAGTCGPSKLTN
jgi:hypothetical protein